MTHILIVDDHPENLYLLRALLNGHGYTVEEARNGREALVSARKNPPDLIVSDLLMPVMDGYTLLRHWKTDDRLLAIPFVVYTATYTDPRDERLALDLGADAFLIKPAEPESFMACVHEVLSKTGRTGQAVREPQVAESVLINEYSEVLIRKLEKRAQQLNEANRGLKAEIAERERTETALRSSEERYRALFHAITDPLFVYDRETLAFLDVNEAAVTCYGYSRDELLAMTVQDIRPAEDIPLLLDVLARSGVESENRGIWRHRKKSGEIIDVEISACGLDYAGRPACVVQARDVTERRQAEVTLRQRDRAIQAVSQGILITDASQPDNPIIYASAGFERMTGYRAEETIGRNCRFLQGRDTDRETVREIRTAISAGRNCSVEILNYRRDGTPFWNQLTISPILGQDGRPAEFVGVLTDVTDRRRLEEQLRQAQKMEAFGQLAGGVAHDFNNLLTIISGYSEILLSMLPSEDSMREAVKAISEAGERAASLTRQMLAFSRQTVLAPKVLDLNVIVSETERMLRRLIGEDVLLTTVLDPKVRSVQVDSGHLGQVLMNLAVNARDAMPRGGKLTIETRNITLDEHYAATHLDVQPGEYVLLAVTDTGEGIAPEVRSRIFEPFFTTKGVGKGTGLGLAVVHGIVKQSGGNIEVYSEPGLGTSFKLYFPAVQGDAARSVSQESRKARPGTETILLVEDEDSVRGLAVLALQTHGYTVLAAGTGKEALRLAEKHAGQFNLLVTDVVMPGMGGSELAEVMRARIPKLKVLFLSGYTDDAVVRHGILQEEVAFLQKPFSPLTLATKVREMLDA